MAEVYQSLGKSRPATGQINARLNLSQSSDTASRFDYGASRANDEIMSLRYNKRSINNRNIRSAIPRAPKSNYRRESIKKKTEKNMRHGKFSKFLDYLLDIKNEAQNTTADDINSLMQSNETYQPKSQKFGVRNMSAPGRARKRPTKDQISEYYILTIAREADNYFQLDEIRKKRIRDMLVDKLNNTRKKISVIFYYNRYLESKIV